MTGIGTIFGGGGTSSGGRERPDLLICGRGVIAAGLQVELDRDDFDRLLRLNGAVACDRREHFGRW